MIFKRNDLKKILTEHSKWVFSSGKAGKLADIKNWKLDKFNLENEDLPFAKLQFVSLRDANLSRINFRQADLIGGIFAGAFLYNADLAGANLSGSDLSFSKCKGASFLDANLKDANFEGADLSVTNFTKATLSGANFESANLLASLMIDANVKGANFKDADLSEVNFTRTNLRDANFEGANLSTAVMVDTKVKGANFKGAKLEGTNLTDTDLNKTKFLELNLKSLDAENKYLSEPDQEDASFCGAVLDETKRPKIVLRNQNLDKIILNQSKSAKEDLFVQLNAVNPNIIEEAINGLMEKIKSNVKFDQLKTICKHQHFIDSIEKIDLKKVDLVMHEGQVAFKLNFNVTYNLDLVVDRKGNFINVFRSIKQIEK